MTRTENSGFPGESKAGGALGRMALALWLGAAAAHSQSNGSLPAGVELRNYTGWVNCLFLNASEIPVQAVVVPAVGGRIVHSA